MPVGFDEGQLPVVNAPDDEEDDSPKIIGKVLQKELEQIQES